MEKTIRQVTLQEWAELANSAIELLSMARFMFWMESRCEVEEEDPSYRDTINRMAAALDAIGLPQISTEQFRDNLEALLDEKPAPNQRTPGAGAAATPKE